MDPLRTIASPRLAEDAPTPCRTPRGRAPDPPEFRSLVSGGLAGLPCSLRHSRRYDEHQRSLAAVRAGLDEVFEKIELLETKLDGVVGLFAPLLELQAETAGRRSALPEVAPSVPPLPASTASGGRGWMPSESSTARLPRTTSSAAGVTFSDLSTRLGAIVAGGASALVAPVPSPVAAPPATDASVPALVVGQYPLVWPRGPAPPSGPAPAVAPVPAQVPPPASQLLGPPGGADPNALPVADAEWLRNKQAALSLYGASAVAYVNSVQWTNAGNRDQAKSVAAIYDVTLQALGPPVSLLRALQRVDRVCSPG